MDAKSSKVGILGTTGSNNSVVVIEQTSNDLGQVKVNAQPNEVIVYDKQSKTFIGTGIFANEGELHVAPGTLYIGEHRLSSGGHSLYMNELTAPHNHRILSQIVDRTGNDTPTYLKLDAMTEELAQPAFDTIITNPTYEIPVQHEEIIFSVHLKVANFINHLVGTNYALLDGEWVPVYQTEFKGSLTPGDFEFKFDSDGQAPLDLVKGVTYKTELRSPNGPVQFYGDSTGMPYFKLDVRHWTQVPFGSGGVTPTEYKVMRSSIAQKISGIHIEDVDNNAFDDITGLYFEGATVSDDGSNQATVTISPKFAIAKVGSQTAHEVNALTFAGSVNVGVNPNDPNVGVIEVTSAGAGNNFILNIKDQAGADTLGIDTLVFDSSIVEPDTQDSKEVRIKPFIEFTSKSVSEEPQVTSVKANTLSVNYPLEVFPNPNAELDAELGLAHGSVELAHAPAYLAYTHAEVGIVGKEGLSGHHDGAIWFDDVVYPTNAFLDVDKVKKSFSIQEADELDPNVTGVLIT